VSKAWRYPEYGEIPKLLLSARYYGNELNLKEESFIVIKGRECSEVSSKGPNICNITK